MQMLETNHNHINVSFHIFTVFWHVLKMQQLFEQTQLLLIVLVTVIIEDKNEFFYLDGGGSGGVMVEHWGIVLIDNYDFVLAIVGAVFAVDHAWKLRCHINTRERDSNTDYKGYGSLQVLKVRKKQATNWIKFQTHAADLWRDSFKLEK